MSSSSTAKTGSIFSYDEIPYESLAYPQTHPPHLSVIASLFGLTPPDFRTARVLELGCSSGGNLIPLAVNYPDASFLGIDLSEEQISQAIGHEEALKLENIEFQQQDILNFPQPHQTEKFDYIIAHGVLSWVPQPVQEKLLQICADCLSPDGIALISYNTMPGWGAVRTLREMMMYHTKRFSSPAEKVQQARALLTFLAESVPPANTHYHALLESERKLLKEANDTYIYHEHLEETNSQFYFHEFARMIASHGLEYVGDTSLTSMFVGNMPAQAMNSLKALDHIVHQEQYMDFIANRRFRSSVICKDGRKLNRTLRNEQIMNYFLTFHPALEVIGDDPDKGITFKVLSGSITPQNKIGTTLLLELAAAGQKPIAAKDLIARVQKKLNMADAKPAQEALLESGLHLVLKGFIHLHADSPHFVTGVSQKPVSFSLARYQAGIKDCRMLTNAVSGAVASNALNNFILHNLDGCKTAEDVVSLLVDSVQKGTLELEKNSLAEKTGDLHEQMRKAVADALPKMAKHALLVG